MKGNFLRTLKGIPQNLEFLEVLDLENNKVNRMKIQRRIFFIFLILVLLNKT